MLRWPDATRVVFYLTEKSAEKTTISVQHLKLESSEAVAERKEYWGERLVELGDLLT